MGGRTSYGLGFPSVWARERSSSGIGSASVAATIGFPVLLANTCVNSATKFRLCDE